MPTYEYSCSKGHTFEIQQGIKDDAIRTCNVDDCEAACKRLISAPSFSLKGGGWYADGYSKNIPRKNKSNDSSSS